jgi:hypothetical protein
MTEETQGISINLKRIDVNAIVRIFVISLIMFLLILIAIILDTIGFIFFILDFFGIGEIPSMVLDVVGALSIGVLLFLFNKSTAGLEKGFIPIIQKIAAKTGMTTIAEFVPLLGDVAPFWTILVIEEIFEYLARV